MDHHAKERVELELKILKYRQRARQMAADIEEAKRIRGLVADLEQKLREIDEKASKPPPGAVL